MAEINNFGEWHAKFHLSTHPCLARSFPPKLDHVHGARPKLASIVVDPRLSFIKVSSDIFVCYTHANKLH